MQIAERTATIVTAVRAAYVRYPDNGGTIEKHMAYLIQGALSELEEGGADVGSVQFDTALAGGNPGNMVLVTVTAWAPKL